MSLTSRGRTRLVLLPRPLQDRSGLKTHGKPISCAAMTASPGLETGRLRGTGTPAAAARASVADLLTATERASEAASPTALVRSIRSRASARVVTPISDD